ncbi:hypothetical protein HNP48_000121 [Acidovorax soli]|uniref:Uncharacterized protein n=1 Tax=Acidovorax soli TaxID=592050 RepID=A0A7X0P8W3_9BURK|nr:hypothetical protein [Acidovorax soli]
MAPCRAAMKNPPAGGLVKKKPAGRRAKGSEEDSEETLAENQTQNSGEAWLRHHQTPQPAAYPLLTLINGCRPFRRAT